MKELRKTTNFRGGVFCFMTIFVFMLTWSEILPAQALQVEKVQELIGDFTATPEAELSRNMFENIYYTDKTLIEFINHLKSISNDYDSDFCKCYIVTKEKIYFLFFLYQVDLNIELLNYQIASFEALGENFARDAKSVYFEGKAIQGADPSSFNINYLSLADIHYQSDINHVYLDGRLIPKADPKTFEIVPNSGNSSILSYYGKDASHVYFYGGLLEDADSNTFEILNDGYSRDAKRFFFYNREVKGIDPLNLLFLTKNVYKSNFGYMYGTAMLDLDANIDFKFEEITNFGVPMLKITSLHNNYIAVTLPELIVQNTDFQTKLIPVADMSKFHILGCGYFAIGDAIYYNSVKLPANPISFTTSCYAKITGGDDQHSFAGAAIIF